MKGIQFCREAEGVRIITNKDIFFLEKVQKAPLKTLHMVEAGHPYKLVEAYKEFMFETDKTESIFREIGANLKDAIDQVIETATLMWNIKF